MKKGFRPDASLGHSIQVVKSMEKIYREEGIATDDIHAMVVRAFDHGFQQGTAVEKELREQLARALAGK